jgi:hypothetical protein
MEHLERFQAIARRAPGNPRRRLRGYDASVAYVAQRLRGAGYDVRLQRFDFDASRSATAERLRSGSIDPVTYAGTSSHDGVLGQRRRTAPLRAAGGIVVPRRRVRERLRGGRLRGFEEGSIALIQRWDLPCSGRRPSMPRRRCRRGLIFNEGNDDRPTTASALSTHARPPGLEIPVVGTSFAVGEELYGLLQLGREWSCA